MTASLRPGGVNHLAIATRDATQRRNCPCCHRSPSEFLSVKRSELGVIAAPCFISWH